MLAPQPAPLPASSGRGAREEKEEAGEAEVEFEVEETGGEEPTAALGSSTHALAGVGPNPWQVTWSRPCRPPPRPFLRGWEEAKLREAARGRSLTLSIQTHGSLRAMRAGTGHHG